VGQIKFTLKKLKLLSGIGLFIFFIFCNKNMTMQLKARNVTSKNTNIDIVSLKNCLKWSEINQFPAKGFSAVEGAFVGVHNNVLIIAGGISFLNTKEQKRRI